MIEYFILTIIGIFIGLLVGMFGIGGGLIIVPTITYILIYFHDYSFNQALIIAIATSLTSIVLSGLVSSISHHFNKNIDWDIFKKFIFGIFVGASLIGFYLPQLPIDFIRLCFASLSGLIGIGGGTLFVPYLTSRGISIKLSIGIASCLGLFIGLFSSITILFSWSLTSTINQASMLGLIYIPAIIFLTLPSLVFVKLSADWLHKISDKNIRRGFACLLIFIGFMMTLKN